MNPVSLIFLALAMSTDAFAAAIGKGSSLHKPRLTEALRTGLIFGVIEAITPIIGWLIGQAATRWVAEWDHWIAFTLLVILGLHMIYNGLKHEEEQEEKIRAFNFTPEKVWNGATSDKGTNICNGLIADWVRWQQIAPDTTFKELSEALNALSPSGVEKLQPGAPRYIGAIDETLYPTLRMPYGEDVPLTHASAGMRRIAALAYLIVWTWSGHQRACKVKGIKPAKEIIFLIDEVECHLHPQWQRRIVPALLNVMNVMTQQKVLVQLIIATHSPLVLASVEPEFDESKDSIFHIRLENGQALIEPEIWAKQGDVVNLLVSETFGMQQARSVEAERAIEAAEAWIRHAPAELPNGLNTERKIHNELVRVLPGGDHFWPRWVVWTENNKRKGSTK